MFLLFIKLNNSSLNTAYRFKTHFKNLNFYSMPHSILFIVRKRLNLVFSIIFLILILLFSII
uniref:Uncharacterized protein n=1 Tax=Oxytricha trifallax TaxID=1172189 RepID=G9HRF0_9SPIT|nr:hypothetical protein [Oxytricha trifallax]